MSLSTYMSSSPAQEVWELADHAMSPLSLTREITTQRMSTPMPSCEDELASILGELELPSSPQNVVQESESQAEAMLPIAASTTPGYTLLPSRPGLSRFLATFDNKDNVALWQHAFYNMRGRSMRSRLWMYPLRIPPRFLTLVTHEELCAQGGVEAVPHWVSGVAYFYSPAVANTNKYGDKVMSQHGSEKPIALEVKGYVVGITINEANQSSNEPHLCLRRIIPIFCNVDDMPLAILPKLCSVTVPSSHLTAPSLAWQALLTADAVAYCLAACMARVSCFTDIGMCMCGVFTWLREGHDALKDLDVWMMTSATAQKRPTAFTTIPPGNGDDIAHYQVLLPYILPTPWTDEETMWLSEAIELADTNSFEEWFALDGGLRYDTLTAVPTVVPTSPAARGAASASCI